MSGTAYLSLLIHQTNQPVLQRMWLVASSMGGQNAAAPPPGDRWLVLLFVMGSPVLAQQWNELICLERSSIPAIGAPCG
jgi:hypothetical protein